MWLVAVICCLVIVIVAVAGYHAMTRPTYEGFDFTPATPCQGPYYVELDGFLTPEQCDALVAQTEAVGLDISQVGIDDHVTDETIRKSQQHWYKAEANAVTQVIRQKTADFFGSLGCASDVAYEDIQVVKYDVGGKYDPHYDDEECGPVMGVGCKPGRRMATLLIYLNDDMTGGTTRFPKLGVDIVPKKGKALFFWVADPATALLYESTIHGGMAVETGHKWIATQWIRSGAGAGAGEA
jgi:prolyl 4-hydroxylase